MESNNETTPVQLGFSVPLPNDDDDDDKDEDDNLPPLLGHQSPHWSDWDGGKIGGRPSWLNPRDLPQSPLRCRAPFCIGNKNSNNNDTNDNNNNYQQKEEGTPLRFVAQLYCPVDDVTENEAAFHRSMYVFACPTCCSSSSWSMSQSVQDAGSVESSAAFSRYSDCIRVLRCQLPKLNEFYPPVGNYGNDEWDKHTIHYWSKATNNDKLNLCAVCGQRGKGKCPKQQLWFCGSDHQKEHLRASKKHAQGDESSNSVVSLKYLPSVCYESELVVEEEPGSASAGNASPTNNSVEESTSTSNENDSKKTQLFPSKDITDDDADLEQSDLNELTGRSLSEAATGVTDPATLAFYARMAIGGEENDVRDQCLRYSRWPDLHKKTEDASATTADLDNEDEDEDAVGPLWLTSDHRPPSQSQTLSFPPPCQYCGAPRSFEFQILPQMLHYLLHDPGSDDAQDKDTEGTNYSQRKALTEAQRDILLEAKSKIESGVELPEGFREQHEAAVTSAREALLGISSSKSGGKANNNDSNVEEEEGVKEGLDWGTIAIFTCTASCGNGQANGIDGSLGAYCEEVAWMQPPLD